MTVELRDGYQYLNRDIWVNPVLLGDARPSAIVVDTASLCQPTTVRVASREHLCIVPADLQYNDDKNESFCPLTLGEAILGCGVPVTEAGQQLIICLNEQIGGTAGLSLRYQEIVRNLQTMGQLVLDCQQFPVVTGGWDWLHALTGLAEMPDNLEPMQKVFWLICRNLLEAVVWMEATEKFPSQADSKVQLQGVIEQVVSFRRMAADPAYAKGEYIQ
jgi:hypothetical protein